MKRIFTLGLLSLSIIFAACKRKNSSDIAQDRIYTEYETVYEADGNKTIAEVTFRQDNVSGKKIQLTFPARVKFRNENMSWKNAAGNYRLEVSGNHLTEEYVYSDIDENTFSNYGQDAPAVALPWNLTGVSRSIGFNVPWQGDAIRNGETITVHIEGKDKKGGSQEWSLSTENSTYIHLDQARLSKLDEGPAEMWIERSKGGNLVNVPDAGGRMTTTYRSPKITIQVYN